jgi:hypothetical protein
VRQAFANKTYTVKKNGRFAVLQIDQMHRAIQAAVKRAARILEWPEDNDPSHSGVFDSAVNDLEFATALRNLVQEANVHPAVV